MENVCYYVNSRGILKSCDFHSQHPISSCNNDYQYLLNMIKNCDCMFDGMSIYVCSDLLQFFINVILFKIKKRFVLVSGDSDLCVPYEALTKQDTNILLNNTYLIKWLVQNTRIDNIPKIIQLPIGLDYHTIANSPDSNWRSINEGHTPQEQETILCNFINNATPFYERINKIYVNFTISNDRFNQRKKSLEIIPDELIVKETGFVKRTVHWENISKYAFVLSPFGNGMDCHRTWETLCLGAIPILKAPSFKSMFTDLPVLIIENWEELNQELLDSTIEEYKTKTFNYDKLSLSYWQKLIKCYNI